MSALTTNELQSLRKHLGFGNVGVGAFPYTNDGFQELFEQVIGPNLNDGNETTATTAVTGPGIATVTVASLTGIVAGAMLYADVGDDNEEIAVRSIGALSFSARFTKAHPAPFAIATVSGTSTLRRLLWRADRIWEQLLGDKAVKAAGLKSLDRGSVVWKDNGANDVAAGLKTALRTVQMEISQLVRVKPAWWYEDEGQGSCVPV